MQLCSHCEDGNNPVTESNGFAFPQIVSPESFVEVFLHDHCAPRWFERFPFSALNQAAAGQDGIAASQ
jgi:hypothetical protein